MKRGNTARAFALSSWVIFGLSLAFAAPGLADQLTAGQIKKLAPASYTGFLRGDLPATIKLGSDGMIAGRTEGKSEVGKWFVRGDDLCIQFKVWTSNKPHCGAVHRDGVWFVGLYENGKPQVKMRRNAGLPMKKSDR
jgi:hypothetical protein